MNGLIRLSTTFFVLALMASARLQAGEAIYSVGESSKDKLQWETYSTGLSDQEYRKICKFNQRRLRNSVTAYSESTLLSMGVPESGVKFVGIAAGLAANRDLTLYLNKSRFLTLEFRNVTKDKRSMFLGFKMDW